MTAIRLFAMCESMKWNHLPQPGGLYDQHPELLEQFMFIFAERAEFQEEERKREESKNKRKNPGGSRSPGGRRR